MNGSPSMLVALPLIALLVLSSACCGADRIGLIVMARSSRVPALMKFFGSEPAVDCTMILARDEVLPDPQLLKLIRLYFPRTYQEMAGYDVIMILSPAYYLLTPTQDKWIHDAIYEGAGGISGSSVFSQIPGIAESWVSGMAWQAYPNDAPSVIARGAEPRNPSFKVEIDKDHPVPVLSIFVPFGVEDVDPGSDTSRLMIAREGADVLAWQVGDFPAREAYIATWDYENGRTISTGAKVPLGWLAYPMGISGENAYSPEILMNMIFWVAKTELIEDVEVFHSLKYSLSVFRARMTVLLSLKDFIDKFGANTVRTQKEIASLEETYSQAANLYLDHDFAGSQETLNLGLAHLPQAEEIARKEKGRALLWVYAIEWLASSSTFFVSGFILWTLMVKRRLYREAQATRLRAAARE